MIFGHRLLSDSRPLFVTLHVLMYTKLYSYSTADTRVPSYAYPNVKPIPVITTSCQLHRLSNRSCGTSHSSWVGSARLNFNPRHPPSLTTLLFFLTAKHFDVLAKIGTSKILCEQISWIQSSGFPLNLQDTLLL